MQILKFWDLFWSYYQSETKTDKLIIVAIWAPNLMDIDNLRNAKILTQAWYDIVTPEYYWFCRSSWKFTPKNSIKTLLDTRRFFIDWEAYSIYSGKKVKVQYNDFIFLGISYGGWVVSLLPKYDDTISKIAMFYPVTNYSTFGKRWVKEETVEDFLRTLKEWFSRFFRWIDLPIWKKHLRDKTDMIPIKNLKYLENSKVFLAHWTNDTSIYYKKTREYYQELKEKFPNGNYKYIEYEWLWHWESTMFSASYDMIKFFKK